MRKQFEGAARKAQLSVGIDDDPNTLTITCDDLTGWPLGGTAPFTITIARDTSLEEKVLVGSRSGNVMTANIRGYDGTTRRSHIAGVYVEHTVDSVVIEEANRLANLLEDEGSMFVFDGVNVIELVVGAEDEVLGTDPDVPHGVSWRTRLIPIAASAPDYKTGDYYYDTTLQSFMVGVGGIWIPAVRGVVAVANIAARNTLFTANDPPAGQMVLVLDEDRLYVGLGTGNGWQMLPKPGEWIVHFDDETAIEADTELAIGSAAMADDTQQLYVKRTAGWVPIGQTITVEDGSGFPSTPNLGDVHAIPVS